MILNRLIKAFRASIAAISFGWKNETALRQELILIIIAIPAAILLTSNIWKLLALWGCLLILLAVEFLNTGIEKLADRITLEHDPLIGIAKDCGSAAVLMALVLAGGVWSVALWERIFI
jgi:diacylglycerol kinase (ATP)